MDTAQVGGVVGLPWIRLWLVGLSWILLRLMGSGVVVREVEDIVW